MKESLRFKGQIKSLTISRVADKWFAAISVETENLPHVRKNQGTVGVDLGVKALATLSNGEVIEGAKAHTALLKRLKRCSRQLSDKEKKSMNFKKHAQKLARLHARIANIRRDCLHKATTKIVLSNEKIGIESLNVKGMSANRKLARHILGSVNKILT
jgi:putative transposase